MRMGRFNSFVKSNERSEIYLERLRLAHVVMGEA